MNSVFVSTKRWLDKTYGNSYFATRVYVDGKEVARLPFQYGYERADEDAAIVALKKLGYLPDTITSGLWWQCKEFGAAYYRTPEIWVTKAEVERWGAPE